MRQAPGKRSRVSSPRRRRRVFGFGCSARGVTALATARNSALIPLASAAALPCEIRGWFSVPPASASLAAGLARVPVTSSLRLRDAVLGFRAKLGKRRLFRSLAVTDLGMVGGGAFTLPRVGILPPDALFDFLAVPGKSRLFRRLAVGDLGVIGGGAFDLPRVSGLGRPLRFVPRRCGPL